MKSLLFISFALLNTSFVCASTYELSEANYVAAEIGYMDLEKVYGDEGRGYDKFDPTHCLPHSESVFGSSNYNGNKYITWSNKNTGVEFSSTKNLSFMSEVSDGLFSKTKKFQGLSVYNNGKDFGIKSAVLEQPEGWEVVDFILHFSLKRSYLANVVKDFIDQLPSDKKALFNTNAPLVISLYQVNEMPTRFNTTNGNFGIVNICIPTTDANQRGVVRLVYPANID